MFFSIVVLLFSVALLSKSVVYNGIGQIRCFEAYPALYVKEYISTRKKENNYCSDFDKIKDEKTAFLGRKCCFFIVFKGFDTVFSLFFICYFPPN